MLAHICLLGAVCSFAHTTPEDPVVSSIVVKGNRLLNPESIIDMTAIKIGRPVSRRDADQAVKNLVSTGLFGSHHPDDPDSAVQVSTDLDPAGNQARVIITVDENDKVCGFNITGIGPIKSSDVKKVIRTRPADILNLNVLRTDMSNIQKLYADRGYQAVVTDVGMTNGIIQPSIVVGRFGGYHLPPLPKRLSADIMRSVKQREGAYFHYPSFEQDLKSIAAACNRHGYTLRIEGNLPKYGIPDSKPKWTSGIELDIRPKNKPDKETFKVEWHTHICIGHVF